MTAFCPLCACGREWAVEVTPEGVRTSCGTCHGLMQVTRLADWIAQHPPERYGVLPVTRARARLTATATDGAAWGVEGPTAAIAAQATAVWIAIRDGARR